ncbi:alpha/beta fold hydrolase [Micromonospora trifolii]|uniref:alpha/beta fold hydrolase n=1 Tax=Micromonospora trifolii TaxID=2911208 RepID=UPI003CE75FE7
MITSREVATMEPKSERTTVPFGRRLLDALAGDWGDSADQLHLPRGSASGSAFLRLIDALAGDWCDPSDRSRSQVTSLQRAGFPPRLIDALAGDWGLAADSDHYRGLPTPANELPNTASAPLADRMETGSDIAVATGRASLATRSAIVLIHGTFSSGGIWHPLTTLLENDTVMADRFDTCHFEYSSSLARLWRKVPDLTSLASAFGTFLHSITSKYDRTVLVTHGSGGLIAQRYLADIIKSGRGLELGKIAGIVMFAPPSSASSMTLLMRRMAVFSSAPQRRELRELTSETSELHRLISRRIIHAEYPAADQYPIPVKAYVGETDVLVDPASAISLFPSIGVLPGDHVSIVKPRDASAATYRALRNDLLQFVATPVPVGTPTRQVVAIAPDSSFVSVGDAEGAIRVWNPVTGRLRHTIQAHDGPVLTLAVAPDASFIVSGSSDRTAKLWNSASGRLSHTLTVRGTSVKSLAVASDSSFLVTGSSDGAVEIWDSRTGGLRHAMTSNSSPVLQLGIAPDNSFVVSGSSDGTIVIWDSATGRTRKTESTYTGSIELVAVAPDGSFVMTGTSDGSIMVLTV